MRGTTQTLVKGTLLLVAAVGLFALASAFDVQQLLREALGWISSLGPWGGIFFIGLYALATVLFLPGFLLTLAAGVLFGVVWGSVLVSVGSITGATLAFLMGRYLARDWVAKRIESNEKFEAIDQAVAGEGWKIVGLVRLSPVFPFNLLNYAFGITKVTLKDYFLASWIGMLPATVMYVYVGSLAGDLATLGSEERSRTSGEWALYIIGLGATIILTLYITKIARNALKKKVV
ncbi:MAG: TVP38/TMEM64 family protein [Acidobacteriota bacterium]